MKFTIGFVSSVLLVAWVCLSGGERSARSLRVLDTEEKAFKPKVITPFVDICPEAVPPIYTVLHDRRPEQVQHFQETVGKKTTNMNGRYQNADDQPDVHVLENHKFAVWKTFKNYDTEASAWNLDGYIHGPGWREPIDPFKKAEELEGDYAAYTTWFQDNFGHFVHDHLPTIAYLRGIIPETTKLMLVDNKTTRNILGFLDKDFVRDRVKWINNDVVYHVKGSLTVSVPSATPAIFGCCGQFDPMRHWMAESHPDRPKQKHVVFYSRGMSTDTHHGRVLDIKHEQVVIQHIKMAMKKYGRQEKFIVFTGQKNGKTMPVADQYAIFRPASTIIGPHGSGLGGNFAWTDPFVSTCEERTKLLEFIPGQESAQVQSLYASYFGQIRKWPFDYHNVLYTKQSTKQTTYINLQDLDDALDAMWGGKQAVEQKQ